MEQARLALGEGEVAVGCVLVDADTDTIVARGRNATNRERHALAHAEFMAVESLVAASPSLPSLRSLVLYVTVEPCIMCAAMLLYNRIGHVFFGCENPRFGGNGTVLRVNGPPIAVAPSNPPYCSEGGHGADRAVALLQTFYTSENAAAPDHKRKRKAHRKDTDGLRDMSEVCE
jgi:tRNA-specific adenosine deaminase 2